jgi:peptidoglycan/LPS O-acetylase OafA/YrhL
MKSHVDLYHVITSYLFIPSYSPAGDLAPLLEVGWSLNFEMLFYVVFALAIALKREPVGFVTTVMVGLAIAALFRTPGETGPGLLFWCDTQVLEFVAGMFIARACQKGVRLSAPVALALVAVGVVALLWDWPLFHPMLRVVLLGIPAALIVAAFAFSEQSLHGYVPAWLRQLGDSSYSLYLVHPVLAPIVPMMLAKAGLPLPWLSVALSITISVIASVIIYRVFEKPVTVVIKRALEGPLALVKPGRAT